MAIAFDAASSGSGSANPGSVVVTIAHTITGANTFLFVGAGSRTAGGFAITGVTATFNGVSMTKIWELSWGPIPDTDINAGFYLVNPASGTHNIVVTYPNTGAILLCECGGASYTGVNQASPIGANNTNSDASGTSTATVTVASAVNNLVVDFVQSVVVPANTITPGAGQTSRWQLIGSAGDANCSAGTSDKAGAASVTNTYALGGSLPSWSIGAVSVQAAVAGGGKGTGRMSLLGVGY